MTETPEETQEPAQEPTESPVGPSEEPAEGETPSEQEPAETPSETPDQPPVEARDDSEIDAVYTKLATKAKNYQKGVAELEGIQGVPLTVCELCGDGYPGLRWQEPRTDEAAAAVNAFHGTMELDSLKQADWAGRCTGCEGRGWVKTASLVMGNEAVICKKCNGSGYQILDQNTGIMQAPQAENGTVEAAPIAGVNPEDPRIKELHQQGYTIIPPMQPVTPANYGA